MKSENQTGPPLISKQYWNNRLERDWSLGGVGHVGYGLSYNKWLFAAKKRIFNHHIRKLGFSLKDLSILDIGSGTGFYIDLWKTLGGRSITGSDIASSAVGRLRKAHPGSTMFQLDISHSLQKHPIRFQQFDIISAIDVLYHIIDDLAYKQSFQNIYKLLVPGGYFLFSENFMENPPIRTPLQVCRSGDVITRQVESAGFQVLYKVPMYFMMNTPIKARGDWPLRLWRVMMLPLRLFNPLGHLYGLLFFPFEITLCRSLKSGPSSDLVICKKPTQ